MIPCHGGLPPWRIPWWIPGLSPAALAHFCLLLAMGSALVTPDLHATGEDEWAALLARVAGALGTSTTQRGMAQ